MRSTALTGCIPHTTDSTTGKLGPAGLDALDVDGAAYPPDEELGMAVGGARTHERDDYVSTVTDTDQMV